MGPSPQRLSVESAPNKRFQLLRVVIVSIGFMMSFAFVILAVLIVQSRGLTQSAIILSIITSVSGVVVGVFSLLLTFLQWHRPRHVNHQPAPALASSLPSPIHGELLSHSGASINSPQYVESIADCVPAPVPRGRRMDWGESPHIEHFQGRDQELAELNRWLVEDRCRLVVILGMGGMGKTALAATVVEQVQEHFDYIFWRSLHNAPPLESILQECISFVSDQQHTFLPVEKDHQITLLIDYCRNRRCLLVLDNVEALMQGGSQAGQYREGCEDYRKLFTRIGESRHQSCMLLTSREMPKEVALLEGHGASTRSSYLAGLQPLAGRRLLTDKGLEGTEQTWETLITHYGGNPLALKLVAQVIREVFGGSIIAFLTDGEKLFSDIRDVLEQQVKRLTALEEEIIFWFAIEREAATLNDLQEDIIHPVSKGALQESLQSLRRRQFVEICATGFTLHHVIIEYVTDRFVAEVFEELRTEKLVIFEQYCLLKAQAKEYIRNSQRRLILLPILQRLLSTFGKEVLEQRFQNLLATQHTQQDYYTSYTAGNVLNLLIQMGCTLRGYDFSHLVVRQAYLQGVDLPEVNFAHANLATSVFTDTFGSIPCVTLSRQGDLLAAGTVTGEIRSWHSISGLPLHIFQGHTDWVYSVVFSPDGKTLASGSVDRTVRLWEVSSGQCLNIFQGHTNQVESVAVSPDGKALASGSDDRTVRLWEVSSGQCLNILQGHTEEVKSVAFSPDGKTLASGSVDRTVRLWEVSSGQCLNILQGQASKVYSVVFSPDGSILASGSADRTVRLWEVSSGQCLNTLHGHTSIVKSVAFSSDGSILASGSADRTVRLWEVSSGHCLNILHGYTNRVESVVFSPDGKILASGNDDRTVRLWEVSGGQCFNILHGHTHWVRLVAFSPDGKILASGSDDRTVRLWEVNSGQCLKTLYGHVEEVNSVVFSPDGKTLASGSVDRTVRLWEMSSGQCLKTLHGHAGIVNSVAFSPDGSILASGSVDRTVRLWEMSSGQCLNILQGHTNTVYSVAFSPDGSILASGSADRTVCLWEMSSGHCLKILQGHTTIIRSVAFSPDGKTLASGCFDQTVRLWEVSSGQCLNILHGHSGTVWSVAFSPDGKTLASGGFDQTVRLWEVSSGQCLQTLRSERPYERMNITQVKGLTEVQKATLRLLGAIEHDGQALL